MGDTRLKALFRAWQSSRAMEDEAALLVERTRAGDLSVAALRLAAECGHNASRCALQLGIDRADGFLEWTAGLTLNSWPHVLLTACAKLPGELLQLSLGKRPVLALQSASPTRFVEILLEAGIGFSDSDPNRTLKVGGLRTLFHIARVRAGATEGTADVQLAAWSVTQHGAGVLLARADRSGPPAVEERYGQFVQALPRLGCSAREHSQEAWEKLQSVAHAVERDVISIALAGAYGLQG